MIATLKYSKAKTLMSYSAGVFRVDTAGSLLSNRYSAKSGSQYTLCWNLQGNVICKSLLNLRIDTIMALTFFCSPQRRLVSDHSQLSSRAHSSVFKGHVGITLVHVSSSKAS